MTYGEARRSISDRVYRFPDGGTYLGSQAVTEAERALAEAESAARVDRARRAFDAELVRHQMEHGLDHPEWAS